MAGVGLLLVGLRLGRKLGPGAFAFLAILLVVGDLFQAGMGENPAITEAHAVQPATPAIRFLQKQEPARFVAVDPYIGVNPLPPDVNMRYGLYDARGYDLPVISTYSQVWTRYVAPPTPLLPLDTPAVPVLDLEFHPAALRILSLMGVTDILEQKAEKPLQLPGVHVTYDGPDATVYANDNALPRTWLVSDQLVEHSTASALTALGSAAFQPAPRRPHLTGPAGAVGHTRGKRPGRPVVTGDRSHRSLRGPTGHHRGPGHPGVGARPLRHLLPGLARDGQRSTGAARPGRLHVPRRPRPGRHRSDRLHLRPLQLPHRVADQPGGRGRPARHRGRRSAPTPTGRCPPRPLLDVTDPGLTASGAMASSAVRPRPHNRARPVATPAPSAVPPYNGRRRRRQWLVAVPAIRPSSTPKRPG